MADNPLSEACPTMCLSFIRQVVTECRCSVWHPELSEAGRASSLHPLPCWSQCVWLSPSSTDKLTSCYLAVALHVALSCLRNKQTRTFFQEAMSASRPGTATRSPSDIQGDKCWKVGGPGWHCVWPSSVLLPLMVHRPSGQAHRRSDEMSEPRKCVHFSTTRLTGS